MGPFIYDVPKIVGILQPLSSLVSVTRMQPISTLVRF